ncbi:ribosomal protein S5 domain 2-type protein [Leucosporidium creatinivorum]|uniref:Ribosomal RNA-processing protein 43 n=1 Tax=Leucosporidium creatinivorum TaxID=106004 RepID=A0A1Y2DPF9_9BASI|nr:ribosomal protein S5 domain 2-type protein [Leucosporidium creatinivorum]
MAQSTTASTEAPAGTSALTPALFKRLHPRPYLDRFLQEGVRPDGRPLGADAGEAVWRDASVNIGSISTAPSSALIRLGNTTLVCGITLEIAPPDITTPNQGFIVPNVDLPALCSPLFRPGPPSDEAQVLSTRLRDILIASNVLPLASLIIEPAKAAFVVYLDVVCLNFDGGILDAAVLACVGALKNLRLPKATWDPDTGATLCEPISEKAQGESIPLNPLPLSVTFGIFNGHLLPDPTLFESTLCTSHITIVVSSTTSKLLHVYQAGAPLFSAGADGVEGGGREQLKACIALARSRAKGLLEILA